MNRTEKRKQNTILYHVKSILKIMLKNIDMFCEWGAELMTVCYKKLKDVRLSRCEKILKKAGRL